MFNRIPSSLRVWTLTLLRMVTAFLFWQHGAQKLFGLFGQEPRTFLTLLWFAGVLEFFGPLFIGFGLFTRPSPPRSAAQHSAPQVPQTF